MAEEKNEKKVSKIKVKKKIWCKILAPKIFAQKEVGESYLSEPATAIGRKLKINLKELTGNIKDQNNYLLLQVIGVSGNTLNTVVIGYGLNTIGIKRAVKKNTIRIDDAFVASTKSGKKVVVKVLMITVNKTQRSKGVLLRRTFREIITEEMSKTGFDNFISYLVNQKIQYGVRKQLSKIYPLRDLSIRSLALQEKGLAQEEIIVEDKTVAPAPQPAEAPVSASNPSE